MSTIVRFSLYFHCLFLFIFFVFLFFLFFFGVSAITRFVRRLEYTHIDLGMAQPRNPLGLYSILYLLFNHPF